jgi:hypothetical protein
MEENMNYDFIAWALSRFCLSPEESTSVILPPLYPHKWSCCLGIIFWNPTLTHSASFICPNPKCCGDMTFERKWTSDSGCKYQPRLLYGIGRNVLLVSALYSCKACGDFLGHDASLLSQLHKSVQLPFVLFHQAGFTYEASQLSVNAIIEGKCVYVIVLEMP